MSSKQMKRIVEFLETDAGLTIVVGLIFAVAFIGLGIGYHVWGF